MKIRAGIIGGAGYTAGELIRLLINHPSAKISFIHSNSHANAPVAGVHSGIEGETNLVFCGGDVSLDNIDVLFLCTPHGESRKFLEERAPLPDDLRIIDLSTDFRAKSDSHDFVYGLPELNRDEIRQAMHIANPGCFATAIQLALIPLAKNELLNADVHIHAITGTTGAGAIPSSTTHFSWRTDNISIYKPFKHQHLEEIRQTILSLQPDNAVGLNFIPLRGDFARGIFASAYLNTDLTIDDAREMYNEYYSTHPFTIMTDKNPDLKQVVNTNKCMINLLKSGDKLLIISVIDNLLKGASGQAVHNMNLLFGFEETAGLRLKPSAF